MKDLTSRIADATSEVMATMFYQAVEHRADLSLEQSGVTAVDSLTASLSFSGPLTGRLLLTMSDTLLEIMTGSFLGMTSGTVSREEMEGTLKEALNMITGNTLCRVDPGRHHSLGIPELTSLESGGQGDGHLVFQSASGFFVISAVLS